MYSAERCDGNDRPAGGIYGVCGWSASEVAVGGGGSGSVVDKGRGTPARLIVVEDDPVTRSAIGRYFGSEGFDVHEAGNAAEGRDLHRRVGADLIFIDIHLPDGNGLDLARELRGRSAVGIIFVTQRDSASDKVAGLELGGDDYVTKPVDLRELLARTRALLRRRALERVAARRASVITFGPWMLDLTRRELAIHGGAPVQLTRAEFDLLAALVETNGLPLGRDYLIEVVSNRNLASDLRTVDSIVARLRRKLAEIDDTPVILTVTGIGYRLGIATDLPP